MGRPCRLARLRLRACLGQRGRRRGRGGATGRIGRARDARAFRLGERCDVAGDLAAFLDRDFPVADLARHFPGSANDQLFSRGQLALEAPADFGDIDAGLAHEDAVLGDLDDAAVHRSLYATFDDQRIAVGDFGALQLDVRTDDQLAHAFTAGSGGFRITAQVGLRRFDPEGFRLCGFGAGRAQGFLQPVVRRLQARGLRNISPAKIVQHSHSSSLSRSVTDHLLVKIRDPKCIALAMRVPVATRLKNHAIARSTRAARNRLSSLPSDAHSERGSQAAVFNGSDASCKSDGPDAGSQTEVLERRLRSLPNQRRTNSKTTSSTGTLGRNTIESRGSSGLRRNSASATSLNPAASISRRNVVSSMRCRDFATLTPAPRTGKENGYPRLSFRERCPQWPLNFGLRFSLNARRPSLRSSVPTKRLYASTSSFIAEGRSICRPLRIACFACRTASGASEAMRSAAPSASCTSLPGSQSLFTRPQSCACSAENGRAARMSSLARRSPMTRGSVCVPPPPGMIPSDTSVSANVAVLDAYAKSQCRTSSRPPA